MGLRRFFLRNDGSNILTYRSGRSYLGVIPFVATLTADSRVVVFQAGVSKNDISVERKPMTFRLFIGRSRREVWLFIREIHATEQGLPAWVRT